MMYACAPAQPEVDERSQNFCDVERPQNYDRLLALHVQKVLWRQFVLI